MKYLNEIGGFRPTANIYSRMHEFKNRHSINEPFELKNKFNIKKRRLDIFDPWQKELYNHIIRGYDDIFVNVNPAGGKTSPIVEAWKYKVSQGIDSKIVWVTPTTQLANQIYYQDLRSSFTDIIMDLLNTPYGNHLFPQITNPNNITPEEFNYIRQIINSELLIFRAGGSSQDGAKFTPNTMAVTCTYPYTAQYVKRLKPDLVIIDEMQEYVPMHDVGDDIGKNKQAKEFIEAIESIPRLTQLVLLTGSMNGNTAKQICEFMNRNFNRNFKNPFIANAPNRAAISIVPHEKMRTIDNIKSLVKTAVRNKDIGNACILYSVKTQDWDGKKAIMPIANSLLQELSQKSIKQITGADPDLSDNKMKKYYGKIPMSHNDQFQQMHYDKKPMNQPLSITAKDAVQNITSDHKNAKWQASWLQHMLNHEGKPVPIDPQLGRPEGFPDPFLAKCILSGFAYMANGKDRDRRMHPQDIRLVQSLFEQGKIYFLLATDMIGVGTTLVVRKLFLPSINKFQGHLMNMGPVDDSSLIQLINRVGRLQELAATIYCDPNDVGRISNLMYNSPHSTVQPAFFGDGKGVIEKQTKMSLINIILSLFRS